MLCIYISKQKQSDAALRIEEIKKKVLKHFIEPVKNI